MICLYPGWRFILFATSLHLPMDPNSHAVSAAPPPPPPPPYAAVTQEIGYYAPPAQVAPHSPTRRGPPEGDGFSESIDTAKYKTRLCQAFMMGVQCTFGNRCAFAHGHHELRHHTSHSPSSLAPPPPPPPPSYHEFATHHQGSAGPSSPLHSRPQTPRSGNPVASSAAGSADVLMSPTRPMHPRDPSLPASPVTAGGDQAYPVVTAGQQRFRNEPYSPTGFVFEAPPEEK